MPYEHSHHAVPSQYISQLAPHALKYSLRSCSEQYNNETALLYSDHKYKQYTVHDCLLPELHLLFILIIKRFHDSISHVQGELFSVQAAHASALHILGWERTCPWLPFGVSCIPNEKGPTPRRVHQEHHHGGYQTDAHVKVTHHSGIHGLFPDGMGVGFPWVHHTFDWHCRLKKVFLCAPCAFPDSFIYFFFKLVYCNCFVLFLLQLIYVSGLYPWERFSSAG